MKKVHVHFLCEIKIVVYKEAFIRAIENYGAVWHCVLIGPFDCGHERISGGKKLKRNLVSLRYP